MTDTSGSACLGINSWRRRSVRAIAFKADAVIDPADDLEAVRLRTEKLALLAQAYKEGLEAGGKEEAERRMRAKFDELNPVDPAPEEATECT